MTKYTSCIAVGGNLQGFWGNPAEALYRSIEELSSAGGQMEAVSSLYSTPPQGASGRQPVFLNAVITARFPYGPLRILALLKSIEAAAGRRKRALNGPRPLDLDLIDHKGLTLNWPASRHRPRLVLPHPEAHRRAFVLVPLLEIVPNWRHPALHVSGRRLLGDLGYASGEVRRLTDGDFRKFPLIAID